MVAELAINGCIARCGTIDQQPNRITMASNFGSFRNKSRVLIKRKGKVACEMGHLPRAFLVHASCVGLLRTANSDIFFIAMLLSVGHKPRGDPTPDQ